MGDSWRGVGIRFLFHFLIAGITACFYAGGNDSVGREIRKKQDGEAMIAGAKP